MKVPQLARATTAISLVVGPALMIVSYLSMPDFGGGHAERLTAIAAAPGTATLSALCFILFQLLLPVGVLGVVRLVRRRVPLLATTALVLVCLGAFGHAVYGGVNVIMLAMAQDLPALETHAEVLAVAEQGVGLPFMAAGLLGSVLGFVLLGVTVWRGGLGPRWLGPALIVWVLLEFLGSSLSEWAGYASGLVFAVVFAALAIAVWRSSIGHWQTAAEGELVTTEPVPA
ncbi:hypothetical protein [Ornithinimicrobium cavernae]|uniref:hypothetical protein n=1 Tax=Ornithinimicrobium cavernae TaxID=2666047 RepID=UPI000D68E0B7|nr:hypothetical protein [Ornithinimicrobium cavernae]